VEGCDLQPALCWRADRAAPWPSSQETILLNESIGSNIAFGKSHCSQAEIERAAKLTQLHDFIVSLPRGTTPEWGKGG
jgi:ATP-binding cassette, subfamily B, heavy metal transporter